jgi:hypothetical protein
MRLIIEARLEGGETSQTGATIVAVVERKDRSVADLGLTLAEGRALHAEVQSLPVSEQTAAWMESQLACHRCGSMLVRQIPYENQFSATPSSELTSATKERPARAISACSPTCVEVSARRMERGDALIRSRKAGYAQ